MNNLRLVARYFAGECTIEERSALEGWATKSKANAEVFDTYRRIWEASGRKGQFPSNIDFTTGKKHNDSPPATT
ncbi:hypothetical protein [Sediminitomix flava]|uniref:FecR family protein n=1 Tax=Sediminitomix flava TaxID=379075 RepID=A0A315Z5X7_SEDFL|nr:hypothetical protein [Sediminitomix flava]PWJ39112.1 hypothetical protein BC781_10613 [Sediminitomix flava]